MMIAAIPTITLSRLGGVFGCLTARMSKDEKPARPTMSIRADPHDLIEGYYRGCTCTHAFIQNKGNPLDPDGTYLVARAVQNHEERYIQVMRVNQYGTLMAAPSKELWPEGLDSLEHWERQETKLGNTPLSNEQDHLGAFFHYTVSDADRARLIEKVKAAAAGQKPQGL